jgi:hypothetical protein
MLFKSLIKRVFFHNVYIQSWFKQRKQVSLEGAVAPMSPRQNGDSFWFCHQAAAASRALQQLHALEREQAELNRELSCLSVWDHRGRLNSLLREKVKNGNVVESFLLAYQNRNAFSCLFYFFTKKIL